MLCSILMRLLGCTAVGETILMLTPQCCNVQTTFPCIVVAYTPSPASRSLSCWLSQTTVTIVSCNCASWHSPGLHPLLDYLPYICHSPWFFPQVLLTLFLCRCVVCVSCSLFILFIKTLPELASWLSVHSLQLYTLLTVDLIQGREKSTFILKEKYH
jgi:hypothetical protein